MDILNEVSLPLGGSLLLFGLWFFVAAVREFNSFKKMSGMETNKVITSGVYAYSRNPQNVGWVLFMLGIAFLGKSLGAILLVLIFTFIFHLHLPTEEKYLSRTLGKSYDEYRKKVPRYFGF
jgi:protein-S-isoprenylcysteine O-methyltransferase Ste14